MNGMELIQAERRRQIEVEGWTPEHDDQHKPPQLANAAACYREAFGPNAPMPDSWPWGRAWWKPKDRIRNLVRAGALFLAAEECAERRGGTRVSRGLYHRKAEECAALIEEA